MSALSWLALGVTALTLLGVVKRVLYPYDLVAWSDDYVLNELVKLRLGAPLYGSYADANSFTYAPGGVLLQHALLAPLGLDLSLVANRVLTQLWLLLAVALGVRLSARLRPGGGAARLPLLAVAGSAAGLTLAGYSNSLADSLHPATLELLVLTIAATFAAAWPRLSRAARISVVTALPACAVCVRQSGASVALALAAVALTAESVSRRERLAYATASLLSCAAALAAIVRATHGAFLDWGIVLPWRQPLMRHHVAYLVTYAAAIAPLLVVVAIATATALRDRRRPQRAAWLRVALFVPCYFVVALPAFLRVGGGAFEFGALTFLLAILGLAQVSELLSGDDVALSRGTLTMLGALQLLLWAPARHVPSKDDREVAARVCAHVREALACGERVLVDMGTACLLTSPLRQRARDRLPTVMELTWAGLGNAPATSTRLAREDYDMVALHFLPLPWPWSARTRDVIALHYEAFTALPPNSELPNTRFGLNDKPHWDDWQCMDWGMVLFERKRESGRHRREIVGPARCTNTAAHASEHR